MAEQNPRSIPGPPLAWAILALGLLLRLYHLGRQSVWVDEYTSFLCSSPYAPMTFHDLWENLHGPLHALTIHMITQWVGINTIILRLPTAIAGALTVPVFYRVAERSLGRGGITAAALAATSPFLIWYSQEARNYSLVILFATAATWAWVEILQTRQSRWWVVYVVSCILGVLSNLSMFFVIAAHAVHWLWLLQRRSRAFQSVKPWVVVVALVAVAVSPWLVQLSRAVDWRLLYTRVHTAEPLRREMGSAWLALPYTLYTYCLGFSMGPSPRDLHASQAMRVFLPHLAWMLPAALFFALLTIKGLHELRKRPNALSLALAWLLVPMVLALYVATRNIKVFNPRYCAVGLPALYLIWTQAFLGMRAPWHRWAAGAALAALWGAALFNHYYNPAYGKDDVRGAGAYVSRNWQPGDYLLTAGAAMPIHFYVSRYWPASHFWLGYAADPSHLGSNFAHSVPPDSRRVWVVSCRPHWYDPTDNFDRFLHRDRTLLGEVAFLGCHVYLVQNNPVAALPPAPPPETGAP